MADFYASTFVGVKDGTKVPADRADGRQVRANECVIVAPKVAAQAYANGDRLFIGSVRAGEHVREIKVTSDTSFGTTTLSIGTTAAPTKYVNAKTMTVTDVPTLIGPKATAADDGPLSADEDIWVTLGVGGIAGGVLFTFEMVLASVA